MAAAGSGRGDPLDSHSSPAFVYGYQRRSWPSLSCSLHARLRRIVSRAFTPG